MRRLLAVLCLGMALLVAGSESVFAQQTAAADNASQASVSTLSYQGVLAKDGVNVPDGDYPLSVTLYRDASNTSSVWTGSYIVHTSNGVFNVLLGSGAYPLPSASELDGTLFLGVRIGDGAELPLTELSSSLSAMNVADGAITAKKMGTDYIGSISVNGQRFSTRGSDVNIVTGDGMLATVDQATNSIVLSATGGSPALNGKGANAEASSYINNSTTLQTAASFNIDGSGKVGNLGVSTTLAVGTTLTVGGASTFNGNVGISGTNSLTVGGASMLTGNVQMGNGLTVSNAPFYSGTSSYLRNTTYIHATNGSGTLLVYGSPSSNSLNPIQQGQGNPYWNGSTGTLENTNIDGYAYGFTDNLAGDVTGHYYENMVGAIRGIPVANNAPSDGQSLTYVAANGDLEYVTGPISTLTDNFIVVGNASNVPTGVAMSGDAAITNTGAVSINANPTSGNHIVAAINDAAPGNNINNSAINVTAGAGSFTTLSASAASPGAASLNATNTAAGPGTQSGAAINVTGAGGTNNGLTLNVQNGTTNNDVVGTNGSWKVANNGNAAFAGISGGYYASSGAAAVSIPSTAFMVEISDPGGPSHIVSITLPAVINGKEIHIHNSALAPTSGDIVVPSSGLFTIMGTGSVWMLEHN